MGESRTDPIGRGSEPSIGPGLMLDLAEQDYLYGVGRLALRIEQLGADPASLPKLEWVRVVGQEVWRGGAARPREVMVRVAALTGALRSVDWLPG